MKIYTKKGDLGTTSLIGGTKVSKSDLRLEAYGTVDELNAHIGLLRTHEMPAAYHEIIHRIQDNLFVTGSILANDPENSKFQLPTLIEADIKALESSIDEMESQLKPLKNFILPGSNPANAQAHICRTVCRRAERKIVALNAFQQVDPLILQFTNRLSDWLFVIARMFCKWQESEEISWVPRDST